MDNAVQICEPIACAICEAKPTETEVTKAPLMTGVPFSWPHSRQVYACRECFLAWMDGAGTTPAEILKSRGIAKWPNGDNNG